MKFVGGSSFVFFTSGSIFAGEIGELARQSRTMVAIQNPPCKKGRLPKTERLHAYAKTPFAEDYSCNAILRQVVARAAGQSGKIAKQSSAHRSIPISWVQCGKALHGESS